MPESSTDNSFTTRVGFFCLRWTFGLFRRAQLHDIQPFPGLNLELCFICRRNADFSFSPLCSSESGIRSSKCSQALTVPILSLSLVLEALGNGNNPEPYNDYQQFLTSPQRHSVLQIRFEMELKRLSSNNSMLMKISKISKISKITK